MSIELEENKILINIHNIYNFSSASYAATNSPTTLTSLAQALNMPEEHIVVEDFNLHHSYWSDPSKITQHAMADRLLNLAEEHELDQTLPAGIII